ncbi:MAG: AI-2E family transporter [Nitrospiraceae bacterium]
MAEPLPHTDGGDSSSSAILKADQSLEGRFTIRSIALTGLFILAVLYTLHIGRVIFLPIAVAVILTVLLAPLVRHMKRFRIPEPIGAAILLSSIIFALGLGIARFAEPAAEWAAKAPDALREAEYKLRVLKKPMQEVNKATELISKAATLEEVKKLQQVEVKSEGWQGKFFSVTGELVAGFVATLILLYFMLSSGNLFLQKLVKVLPRLHDKKEAVEIVREIEGHLFQYLLTVTCINLCLGAAVGMSMYVLGMPNPLLWGLMAALLTFIPYLGHVVGIAVVALVAALAFDDVSRMFLVAGIYWGLAVVEGSFVSPMVLGHRLALNPVVLLIGLMLWGWIWGIGGALLAVPLLVAFKIFCDHVEPLSSVGDFIGK